MLAMKQLQGPLRASEKSRLGVAMETVFNGEKGVSIVEGRSIAFTCVNHM